MFLVCLFSWTDLQVGSAIDSWTGYIGMRSAIQASTALWLYRFLAMVAAVDLVIGCSGEPSDCACGRAWILASL